MEINSGALFVFLMAFSLFSAVLSYVVKAREMRRRQQEELLTQIRQKEHEIDLLYMRLQDADKRKNDDPKPKRKLKLGDDGELVEEDPSYLPPPPPVADDPGYARYFHHSPHESEAGTMVIWR